MAKCKHEIRKSQMTSIFVRVEKTVPFTLDNSFTQMSGEVDDSPRKGIVKS